MQAAVAERKNLFIEGFEAPGPDWLKARRREAIAAFEQRGLPTKRWEAWRNLDVAPLLEGGFSLPTGQGSAAPAAALAEELGECYRLVFVDGRLSSAESRLDGLPAGVKLTSLAEAWDEAALEQDLAVHADGHEHPFAALNTAFFVDGAWLRLDPGVVLDKPVLLQFVATEEGATSFPRVLVQAGRDSELQLIEHYADGGATSLTCPVTELVAEPNARVQYYRVQQENAAASQIGVVTADAARDARISGHCLARGARTARTDLYGRLNDTGAEVIFDGLYLLRDGQFTDFHTWVEHRSEHGQSGQLFKGVLDGKSESVFDGLVKVHPGAQKTNAEQQNRNLLLSRRALAHSNPRLEIYADDVKCSHGSTTGELDEEAMFYMRARGIGAEQARGLLTYAFAAEVLEPIRIPALYEYEARLLREMLRGEE